MTKRVSTDRATEMSGRFSFLQTRGFNTLGRFLALFAVFLFLEVETFLRSFLMHTFLLFREVLVIT